MKPSHEAACRAAGGPRAGGGCGAGDGPGSKCASAPGLVARRPRGPGLPPCAHRCALMPPPSPSSCGSPPGAAWGTALIVSGESQVSLHSPQALACCDCRTRQATRHSACYPPGYSAVASAAPHAFPIIQRCAAHVPRTCLRLPFSNRFRPIPIRIECASTCCAPSSLASRSPGPYVVSFDGKEAAVINALNTTLAPLDPIKIQITSYTVGAPVSCPPLRASADAACSALVVGALCNVGLDLVSCRQLSKLGAG